MHHKKHVWERAAKVSAVNGAVPAGLGRIDVFAARAIELDGFLVRDVGETDGKKELSVAEDSGTFAKVAFLVFLALR